ncbi:MAG: helix-turn-helix transcriptional regulator [Clostridiales bacterium]|nr:helix-turn-helix transcriptional regulator [Clostridiales bacterium]
MSDIQKIVGQRIRSCRKKKGFTQEKLAEKSDLHPTYIGMIERGEKNLSITSLEKILSALNISFSDFFQMIEEEKQDSIPGRCYTLVDRQSDSNQRRLYRILQEVSDMLDNP